MLRWFCFCGNLFCRNIGSWFLLFWMQNRSLWRGYLFFFRGFPLFLYFRRLLLFGLFWNLFLGLGLHGLLSRLGLINRCLGLGLGLRSYGLLILLKVYKIFILIVLFILDRVFVVGEGRTWPIDSFVAGWLWSGVSFIIQAGKIGWLEAFYFTTWEWEIQVMKGAFRVWVSFLLSSFLLWCNGNRFIASIFISKYFVNRLGTRIIVRQGILFDTLEYLFRLILSCKPLSSSIIP